MMSGAWAPTAWNLPFAEKAFDHMHEARIENPQTVNPDALVAYFGSMGWVANLPHEERQPPVDAMRSRVTAAEYVLPWQTRVHWTRLSAPREPNSVPWLHRTVVPSRSATRLQACRLGVTRQMRFRRWVRVAEAPRPQLWGRLCLAGLGRCESLDGRHALCARACRTPVRRTDQSSPTAGLVTVQLVQS